MRIKTLLNKVERFKSFVYGAACATLVDGVEALVIDIEPQTQVAAEPVCRIKNDRPSVETLSEKERACRLTSP